MSATEFRLVYITAKDLDEARKIVKDLLVKKLIACANINTSCLSMYWWQDQIMEDTEVQIIAKTKAHHVPTITEQVKELHSYDVPCVVSYPVEDGNEDFLSWISENTRLTETDA